MTDAITARVQAAPTSTFGEVARYVNGRGFKKSDWGEIGRPIIRIQNLTGSGNEFNFFDGDVLDKHIVKPGDFLISWAATLDAFLWDGPEGLLNQHIFKVETSLNKKYHWYYTKYALRQLYAKTQGTGMVHVTRGKFDETPIKVPTPEIQEQVADYLDTQFSRLANAEASLKRAKANLERYRRSVLHAACTGKLVPTEATLAKAEGHDYEPAEQLLKRILVERRKKWEEAEIEKARAKGRELKGDAWKKKYVEPASPDIEGLPELPEGWCWASFEQLFATRSDERLKLPQKEYMRSGSIAVVDQGERCPAGYSDRHQLMHPGPLPVIAFGDHTRRLRLIDFSFIVGADGLKLIDPAPLLPSSWSLLFLQAAKLPDKGYSRHFQYLRATPIPLPPLAEALRIAAAQEKHEILAEAAARSMADAANRLAAVRQSLLQSVFGSKQE